MEITTKKPTNLADHRPTDARSGVKLPIFCHLIHQVQHHLPLPSRSGTPWNQLRMPWGFVSRKKTRSKVQPPTTKKLPVGIFWLREYSWCQEEILGGKEKSERIWSHDLSRSRVCIQYFCLQSDCLLKNHARAHLSARKYTNTTDTV